MFFFSLKQLNRAEDGPYKSQNHLYFNMDVPGYYLCGKSPETRTNGVIHACEKSIQSNGHIDCFVEFYRVDFFFNLLDCHDILLLKVLYFAFTKHESCKLREA